MSLFDDDDELRSGYRATVTADDADFLESDLEAVDGTGAVLAPADALETVDSLTVDDGAQFRVDDEGTGGVPIPEVGDQTLDAAGQPLNGRWFWLVDGRGDLQLVHADHFVAYDPSTQEEFDVVDSSHLDYLLAGWAVRPDHSVPWVVGFPGAGAGTVLLEGGYIADLRHLYAEPLPEPERQPVEAVDRLDRYEGEDTRVGWRARNPATGQTNAQVAALDTFITDYEDRATLDDRRASPGGDGRVRNADGELIHGEWGWVIDDEAGYLLLFDPDAFYVVHRVTGEERLVNGGADSIQAWLNRGYKVRAIHHTTPVAGFPVRGAGQVSLDQGYIVKIDDKSGHYQPGAEHTYESVQQLREDGYELHRPASDEAGEGYRDAKVGLVGHRDPGKGIPAGKNAWLAEEHAKDSRFPTGDISMSADQFLQSEGNEAQIRWKQALNAEIKGPGAHRDLIDDGEPEAPVAHTAKQTAVDDIASGAESSSSSSNPSSSSSSTSASADEPDDGADSDAPTPESTVTWDEVDWTTLRSANQVLLKDTPQGASIPYWQVFGGLIIGADQPLPYRTLFEELRGEAAPSGNQPSGYIKMLARGGVGTRGRIEVTGDYDESAFKSELRTISNKEIRFR